MQPKTIMVLSTVPTMDTAKVIARELINTRLAPCANIISGLLSVYTWKGEMHEDGELLVIIKTRESLFEKVRDVIVQLHPYEVPEIIALPIIAGHEPYMAWITENTIADT